MSMRLLVEIHLPHQLQITQALLLACACKAAAVSHSSTDVMSVAWPAAVACHL